MTNPIPVVRKHRKSDPRTSVEAARLAAKASLKAMQAVESVMQDGKARIDEEIWQACRQAGYISSFDTIRHGRLALSEAGVLTGTSGTRATANGAQSREWVLNTGFCFSFPA